MVLRSLALLAILSVPFNLAQSNPTPSSPKTEEAPKFLLQARYVYVEAMDGDVFDLRLLSEDRKAIIDVQNALRQWNRYMITVKRREADLVFVVRKGRIASAQGSVGGGVSNGPVDGPVSRHPQTHPNATAGVGAEVGPPDDLLYVYTLNSEGQLLGPIWKEYMKNGLNTPDIPLFKQLKDAVESATVKQQPAKTSAP